MLASDPSSASVRPAGQFGPAAASSFAERATAGRDDAGGPRRRPLPPKLYRISDLAAYSGVSRQTIHNYTTMGLLVETRWTPGGHRLYDESAFDRLDLIAEMKAENRSMESIRRHFGEAGSP